MLAAIIMQIYNGKRLSFQAISISRAFVYLLARRKLEMQLQSKEIQIEQGASGRISNRYKQQRGGGVNARCVFVCAQRAIYDH